MELFSGRIPQAPKTPDWNTIAAMTAKLSTPNRGQGMRFDGSASFDTA